MIFYYFPSAERRKTWSGSPQKPAFKEDNYGQFSDGEQAHFDDPNNNSYTSSKDDSGLNYSEIRPYDQNNSLYNHENSSYGDNYYGDNYPKGDYSTYTDDNYDTTSFRSQPNFKI